MITAIVGLRVVKQRWELVSSMSTTPSAGGGSSSAVGHRFPARAVVPVWTVDPAVRRR